MKSVHVLVVLTLIGTLGIKPDNSFAADFSTPSHAPKSDLITVETRLFDSPVPVSDITPQSNSTSVDSFKSTHKSKPLLFFNGVLTQGGVARIWIDNQPLNLWRQAAHAEQVRWDPLQSTLEVLLNDGRSVKLVPGQTLYRATDGTPFVRSTLK